MNWPALYLFVLQVQRSVCPRSEELLMSLLFSPHKQCDTNTYRCNLLILKTALMPLVLLLSSLYLSHTVKVSAVEVNTPEEIFVENGTDAKLPCTFTSVEVISSAASVSWSFQPEGAATRISVRNGSRGTNLGGEAVISVQRSSRWF